ncbi:DISARM system helicase DrmA [Streptomyces sp. 4503]|uniref:DISARM system helicase DrmA n=1 Tax=Streptomyces niphimycinicus TaxID=2842201 RepID=A0ABS6CAW9_9ACTN|nr:DISARM system helicase DrmA [Streptomyces niphimycinicus]MBU3864031.1 DISARM system helicase DrmA [Streptomyces niphimycinicus]
MSERDHLVEDLVAEILGPRGGPIERLGGEEDPLDEYIVGVLAPFSSPSVEVDSDQELVGDEPLGGDDDLDPGESMSGHQPLGASLPPLAIDPRARPSSMGVSLAVNVSDSPRIDICGTWARYGKEANGEWLREPHGAVWRDVDCSVDHSLSDPEDPGVVVRVRSRRDSRGIWKISVFVVNQSTVESDRPSPSEHVFQPQVRLRCQGGVELVPLEHQHLAQDEEDESLALLYEDRPVLARGHLCSAVWRQVDPERPCPGGLEGARPPFRWSDGRHLFDDKTVAEFEPAEVRSEFVPVVPVNAPDKGWPTGAGDPPELDPVELAEITDGAVLRRKLEPLADAYERWIEGQASGVGDHAPGTPAHRHLSGCRRALDRIRDGIELLAGDRDAFLAFCFANRAIALQSQWTKGRVNRWWPFQLAFQMVNLRGVVDDTHEDREVCDLLWFPTGGGKTEAYLGLAAFTLAFRRLRAQHWQEPGGGAGVTVLSRYTLRLLTIQQYRRALAMVTACEFLRVSGSPGQRGWRPSGWEDLGDVPWGSTRFSVGLWVGGNVTPNNLQDFEYRDANNRIITRHGAISILEGKEGEGDPAQILNCPACRSTLALPPEGLREGDTGVLHLVVGDPEFALGPDVAPQLSEEPFDVTAVAVTRHADPSFVTVSVWFRVTADVSDQSVDKWFDGHARRLLGSGSWLVSARASRPGYFVRTVEWGKRRSEKPVEFEIFCPNPECSLNSDLAWSETTEVGAWPVLPAFDRGDGSSTHCPVPAWTVDEQVYARCPSMVVATVDKFARLAFEPRAGALFGNVDRLNEHLGYYRAWAPPAGPATLPRNPREEVTDGSNVQVRGFRPPDLVLQDELHLIEGPLGSMVGLYEAGIDILSTVHDGENIVRPKYVASTATVRRAEEQVRSLFDRSLEVFPPQGLRAEETFFSSTGSSHPLDAKGAGRLHVGVIAPGRGAQTPIVRMWSRLLQTPRDRLDVGVAQEELDPFWTLVGYFNAIRELAGAVALARQDIPQRLGSVAASPRTLDEQEPMELSSRTSSLRLPGMLEELGVRLAPDREPANAVVATSMFGTGVDVDRLGLMVVHGQPKTTSSYIQATGRVGRGVGGLVVTFYRASRPRDLSHYEYFTGYHTTLYRHVEPVTVNPFAPRARDRALGPVMVSVLRQAASVPTTTGSVTVDERWRIQQRLSNGGWSCRAHEMRDAHLDPEVDVLPGILEERAAQQPALRRPPTSDTEDHARSELERWRQVADRVGGALLYHEPTVTRPASRPVVLGDLAHHVAGTGEAYENAPNSLREVEATTTVKGRG